MTEVAERQDYGGWEIAARLLQRRWMVGLLFAAAALFFAMVVWSQRKRATEWDFSHYYASALALRSGLDPYQTDLTLLAEPLGLHVGTIDRAGHSPALLLLFVPLTLLTPLAAYWVWISLSVVLLVASWWLLGPAQGLPPRPALLLLACVLLYEPVGDHFYYAQTQILVLFLIALGVWTARKGGAVGLALSWALAGLLKLFPLFLGVRFAVRLEWRRFAAWGAAVAALLLATLGLAGVGRSASFVHQFGYLVSDAWWSRPGNFALRSVILRWTTELLPEGSSLTWLGSLASWIAVLAVTASTAWVSFRRRQSARDLGLWITTMLLVAPTAWLHYMVLLLLPFAETALGVFRRWAPPRALHFTLASFLLAELALGPLASIGPLLPDAAQWVLRQTPFVMVALAHVGALSLARAQPDA